METNTFAALIFVASAMAAAIQVISSYQRSRDDPAVASLLGSLPVKPWIWLTGLLAFLSICILPLIGLAGWVLGLVLVVAIVPLATVAMAVVAPVPWGMAATSVGLFHLAARAGMWLAGAQPAQGDQDMFTKIYIGNALIVVIVVVFRRSKDHGQHS